MAASRPSAVAATPTSRTAAAPKTAYHDYLIKLQKLNSQASLQFNQMFDDEYEILLRDLKEATAQLKRHTSQSERFSNPEVVSAMADALTHHAMHYIRRHKNQLAINSLKDCI